jgi:hypothetical protein
MTYDTTIHQVKPATDADIPGIQIGNYRVQMESDTGTWLTCGERYWEGMDVVQAETFLNELRDTNPERNYRLIRDMVITEVVHA